MSKNLKIKNSGLKINHFHVLTKNNSPFCEHFQAKIFHKTLYFEKKIIYDWILKKLKPYRSKHSYKKIICFTDTVYKNKKCHRFAFTLGDFHENFARDVSMWVHREGWCLYLRWKCTHYIISSGFFYCITAIRTWNHHHSTLKNSLITALHCDTAARDEDMSITSWASLHR